MKKLLLVAALLGLFPAPTYAQTPPPEPPFRRWFVGTSAFMLFNFLPLSNSFYQLNGGYWLNRKNVVSLELITWRYHQPLGMPYGASTETYPGYVREYGLGVAYQHYFWRGLYAAGHATPLLRRFLDDRKQPFQNGFQLFLTGRVGYHVPLHRNRFFIEPSIAVTHWPITRNTPEAFAQKDRRWPNYFLFEPGLHVGVKL